MRDEERLTRAYDMILRELVDVTPGTENTPKRAAKAMLEMTEGYTIDVPALFTAFDGENYTGMVAMRGVPFISLCEHHMLVFAGTAYVVYIPGGRVIGASKIPRLIQAYAKRLQVQERMTAQIADALVNHLKPAPTGVLVRAEAEHSCMKCRGVRSEGTFVTQELRGLMKTDAGARPNKEKRLSRSPDQRYARAQRRVRGWMFWQGAIKSLRRRKTRTPKPYRRYW